VPVADAISYVWSAARLRSVSADEPRPVARQRGGIRREIAAGLRFVIRQPVLRAIALNTAVALFVAAAGNANRILFLVRTIGLSAGTIGLLGMASLRGAIPAGLLSRRLTNAIGQPLLCIVASLVLGAATLLVPVTDRGWRLTIFVAPASSPASPSSCYASCNPASNRPYAQTISSAA
jgi:hypothetical protein